MLVAVPPWPPDGAANAATTEAYNYEPFFAGTRWGWNPRFCTVRRWASLAPPPLEGSGDGAAAATGGGTNAAAAERQVVVFVLGAPGSGKSTAAATLAARASGGWTAIYPADLIRAMWKSDSPLGKIVASHVNKGQPVPVAVRVLRDHRCGGGGVFLPIPVHRSPFTRSLTCFAR